MDRCGDVRQDVRARTDRLCPKNSSLRRERREAGERSRWTCTSLSAQHKAKVLRSVGGRELAECGVREAELTEGARLLSNEPRLLSEAGVEMCSAISRCPEGKGELTLACVRAVRGRRARSCSHSRQSNSRRRTLSGTGRARAHRESECGADVHGHRSFAVWTEPDISGFRRHTNSPEPSDHMCAGRALVLVTRVEHAVRNSPVLLWRRVASKRADESNAPLPGSTPRAHTHRDCRAPELDPRIRYRAATVLQTASLPDRVVS